MRAMIFSFSPYDLGELPPGSIEVFVNYSVFELAGTQQFLARVFHPAPDDGVRILAPGAHAPLELLDRRRQDEDADAVGKQLAHLARALPVDLENKILAALHRVQDHLFRGAVAVAVDFGALQELAAVLHGEKRRIIDEVVVDAVPFAGSGRPGRIRNRDFQARILAHHRLDEGSLACSGRRSDDEELAFVHYCGLLIRYSAPARASAR